MWYTKIKMITLTCVIIAKNEEKQITDAITSASFCDEIVVIDNGSSDKTVEISQKLGAVVYSLPTVNDFSQMRNFGLKKAQGKWVLFLDADERISEELKNEIIQAINNPSLTHVGYLLKREDFFLNYKVHFGGFNKYLLRLGLRESGEWKRRVHETWKITGKKRNLRYPLIHISNKTLGEYLTKINLYFETHASENYLEGKKSNIVKIVLFPVFKFIASYIFKLGFLDKEHGFVNAMFMSFHSFLTWSHLWLKQKTLLKKSY